MKRGETGIADLSTRTEVHEAVVDFYREIAFDDLLGPVFGEVAEVDWAVHIPKLIDYWCRVLLGEPCYDGFLLGPHDRVHALEVFTPAMFDRWYGLWVACIDRGWRGPCAEQAKSHAARMAGTLSRRLLGQTWTPPQPGSQPSSPGRVDVTPTS